MTHTAQTNGCAVKPTISIRPRAVKVNGVTIARDAIARETQNHPAAKPIDAWREAARALVVRELLVQEASRLGVEAEPLADAEGRRETIDEARMRALVEREVVTPEPGEEECRRYYARNLHRFRTPDLYEVSHILLPAGRDAGERETVRTAARDLAQHLHGHPQGFSDCARAQSACPSRQTGGSLGQIGPGQTVPEFERALAVMTPGEVHPEPVETRYGFHIVHVARRVDGRQLPFEMVRARIADYLAERVRRTACRQYVSLLAGRAAIEGVDFEAAASPLLQ